MSTPTAEIVDAHHHIWWIDRTPWLSGPPVPRIFGSYEPLRRDYEIAEFAAAARPAGVAKSVYVQVNVAPGDEVDEVGWAAEAGAQEGLIQGIVAFADLSAPDVGEILDRQIALGPVRGIRQQLHWHPEPALRFADAPDRMTRKGWQRGLSEVTTRGLLFELQVFPEQYDATLALAESFHDTRFVLLHAGMLVDRSPEGLAAWRRGMERFAALPNVWVKLSGLGTFVRGCSQADWKPVVSHTVQAFGPDRCMFGSNFPIEGLWTSYAELVSVFTACLEGLDPNERQRVMSETATELYGI